MLEVINQYKMAGIDRLTRDELKLLQERKRLDMVSQRYTAGTRGYEAAKKLERRGLVGLDHCENLFGEDVLSVYLTKRGTKLYNGLKVE